MHSALFVATIPKDTKLWDSFLAKATRDFLDHPDAVEQLAVNVWLIRLDTSPGAIGRLMGVSGEFNIICRYHLFEQKPEWNYP